MILVETSPAFRFGRFTLEPDRRVLRADDDVVPLGARAFDMLLLLVRHRDRVVSKDEILASVWAGRLVEENNLAVHVSALRRALGERAGGERFIATVSGIGYRFVGAVEETRSWTTGTELIGVPDEHAMLQDAPEKAGEAEPVASGRGARRRGLIAAAGLSSVLLLSVAGWRVVRWAAGVDGPPPLSIAVVPFRDLDGAHPSFADAMTDDLTADLSFVPGSVVIARDSTESFRESQAGAAEIGRSLKVRYLVEGSLLADGPKLHVDTELVDTQTERQLWASMFDVEKADVADRLQEVVRRVSSVLRVTLVDTAARAVARARDDPDALDLLWQARSVLDRRNDYGAYVEAQGLLERAVEIAPHDGDVLADLGLVLVHKVGDFDDPNEVADHDRAVLVTRQALSLSPDEPLALTAAGMLAWLDYRCGEAQAAFRSALSQDPNDLQARNGLAVCARDSGNLTEMIAQEREVLAIDPVGSLTAPVENSIGMGYLLTGKPANATMWLEKSRNASSGQGQAGQTWQEWRDLFLIAALQEQGETARARTLYDAFNKTRAYRSRFQLAQYFSRALSRSKGVEVFLAALGKAGMPEFPDPDIDCGVKAVGDPQLHDDFAPTPTTLPGGSRIDTGAVRRMLTGPERPLVLDFSLGASVMPGAIWMSPVDQSGDLIQSIRQKIDKEGLSPDRPIIMMSYSAFGWKSYNAALLLIRRGFHHVFWYRGGEADWKKAGLPTEDRRTL